MSQCNFRYCKKEAKENGFCAVHHQVTCVSCGAQAIATCKCGDPLCGDCRHDAGGGHTPKSWEHADKALEVRSQLHEVQAQLGELNEKANALRKELLKTCPHPSATREVRNEPGSYLNRGCNVTIHKCSVCGLEKEVNRHDTGFG
jgi:hypothetical protein